MTHIRGLITPIRTIHEPSSRIKGFRVLGLQGFWGVDEVVEDPKTPAFKHVLVQGRDLSSFWLSPTYSLHCSSFFWLTKISIIGS